MPDNVTRQGDVVATDEIAGVHYQRVKLALGATDAASDWRKGEQTAAECAPVVLASDKALPVPNTAAAVAAVSVSTTPMPLPASALANRKRLHLQNRSGSVAVFVGPNGLNQAQLVANGIELGPYAERWLEVGPAVVLVGATSSGSADVRVLELS